MIDKELLLDSWKYLNKRAALGVDRVSAREYEQDLESNVEGLVESLKKRRYRAKLVRRHYILDIIANRMIYAPQILMQ